jgi:hypothetical protein
MVHLNNVAAVIQTKMKEQLNVAIHFDKNWIVKPMYVFQNLPLSEVMNRIIGNMDANETQYSMAITLLDDGYKVVFSFTS